MPRNDDYGLLASGLSPEFAAEARGLTRQQAIQEALLQQSLQPMGGVIDAGHFKVARSPWEGIAKVAQAYLAKQGLDEGNKKFADLGKRYQDMNAAEIAQYVQRKSGVPGTPGSVQDTSAEGTGSFDMSGMAGPANVAPTPAVAADPRGAITQAMLSRNPMLQKLGAMDYAQMAKPPAKTDLGDRWKVEYGDGRVAYETKGVTPDGALREGGQNTRFAGVSGNTAATIAGANARHASVSGNTAATIAGENLRHGEASGSAKLTAETTRRGLDQAVDPAIQGRLAEVRAGGKERGEVVAQAALSLPQVTATAEQGINLIDQMIGDLSVDAKGKMISGTKKPHPGFSVAVGASAQPGFQYVPGTDKAGFYALKDQVLGGAFLQAFVSLKGGGAISEVEGKKGTDAITRMSTAQSEAEFVKAAREFQDVVRGGVDRVKQKASSGTPAAGKPIVVDW